MFQITRIVLFGKDVNFHFISDLFFIVLSIYSISLFDIAIEKRISDRTKYSDNFKENYQNNRNRMFLLQLFCLALEDVRRFKHFSFHSQLF